LAGNIDPTPRAPEATAAPVRGGPPGRGPRTRLPRPPPRDGSCGSPSPAERDEERLEEVRELNRATKEATVSPPPAPPAPPLAPACPPPRRPARPPRHATPPGPSPQGEYLTDEEIAEIRTPKWTDRREFVDDD